MEKDTIVLISRIFISVVGFICLAVCIAQPGENKLLLSAGLTLNTIALLSSCISTRKDK